MPDLLKDKKALKTFGLMMGVVFSIISAVLLYKNKIIAFIVFGGIAGALYFSALVYPVLLTGVYVRWMKFAEVIGRFNAKVILSLMYATVFTLFRVFLFLLRKDLLQKKINSSLDSYWTDHEPMGNDPKRYEKQF